MILEGGGARSRYLYDFIRCDIYDVFWMQVLLGGISSIVGIYITGNT